MLDLDPITHTLHLWERLDNQEGGLDTIVGKRLTYQCADNVRPLLQEVEALRAFLNDEVLPRYVELFESAGLGDPSTSVVIERARSLLMSGPTQDGTR